VQTVFLLKAAMDKSSGDRFTLSVRKNAKRPLPVFDVTGKLLKSGVVGKRKYQPEKGFRVVIGRLSYQIGPDVRARRAGDFYLHPQPFSLVRRPRL